MIRARAQLVRALNLGWIGVRSGRHVEPDGLREVGERSARVARIVPDDPARLEERSCLVGRLARALPLAYRLAQQLIRLSAQPRLRGREGAAERRLALRARPLKLDDLEGERRAAERERSSE
eukprot:scaffold124195_cov27-Tisochrysis_lutea.AAC.3